MKASYNVTNAYLSIPTDKASDVILQQLSDDYDDDDYYDYDDCCKQKQV